MDEFKNISTDYKKEVEKMPKCLIVDDSEGDRLIAQHTASSLGFSVLKASSGKQGLIVCQEQNPDFILLDWRMPEMDGAEFIKILRNSPWGKYTVVVMCSAVAQPEKIQQAISAGVDAYIIKPLTDEKLKLRLIALGVIDSRYA